MTSPRLPLALRVLAWRVRPVLLVAALVGACALAARLSAPPEPPTAPVVVARSDLAAGQVLAAGDLRTVRLPAHLVPDTAASDAGALVGAHVAVEIAGGVPVVEAHLARSRFAHEPPSGTVAVPLTLADEAVAALLRPGDRVDLVTGAADSWAEDPAPRVLARAALVLEVRRPDAPDDGALGLLPGGLTGVPLLVVAVAPEEGHLIAATDGGSIGAVLVPGS